MVKREKLRELITGTNKYLEPESKRVASLNGERVEFFRKKKSQQYIALGEKKFVFGFLGEVAEPAMRYENTTIVRRKDDILIEYMAFTP